MMKTVGVLAALSGAMAAAPSSFPFENEAYVPPPMVPGTPDLSFTPESDPGGYVYTYQYSKTLTEEDFPYCTVNCGRTQYLFVNSFSAPPVIPLSVWNCTAKGLAWTSSDYTGLIDNNKICDVGSCCALIDGMPKFSEDAMDWHATVSDRAAAALCGDMMEGQYCLAIGGDFHTNCIEYFINPEERLAVFICPDVMALYYLGCPVFATTYAPVYDFEPDSYDTQLTNEDMILLDAYAFGSGDKICHPYSYYAPSTSTASSSESETAGTSASESGTSASESGTSASESGATVACALSVAAFMIF